MTKKFYVYKHLTADTREVFYVGKGLSRRVKSIKRNKNKKHTNIAKKHGVIVEVVLETDNEAKAFAKEIELIAELHTYVGDPEANHLASNLTIGGEGSSGHVHSDESRAKIKDAHNTPEVKQRHRDNTKTAMNKPEIKQRHRDNTKVALNKPEIKQKIRDNTKAAMNKPEIKQRHRDNTKVAHSTPEYRAKCSESQIKRHAIERELREADPQKMLEHKIKQAEARRKQARTIKLNKLQQLGTALYLACQSRLSASPALTRSIADTKIHIGD